MNNRSISERMRFIRENATPDNWLTAPLKEEEGDLPRRMSRAFDRNQEAIEAGRGLPKDRQLDLDSLSGEVQSKLDHISDVAGDMAKDGDDLGDILAGAAQGGDLRTVAQTIKDIKDRNEAGSVDPKDESAIYKVTSPGGLGSDRGNYVEQGLTDHVFPQMFSEYGDDLQFFNDGGSRVKTDVRSQSNGEDLDRYTVKTTVGNDGLEANNAGFRRFFEMWDLDPQSGPGKMFSHLMGIPLDWAQSNSFGDGLGLWNDQRDGLHRDGAAATRKMPIQLMYPDLDFTTEELNANSFSPQRMQQMFPKEMKEGMEWLMDSRPEIIRRIMSQRDNDFGPNGAADPDAVPNVDFDPSPTNRAAWYHLDKQSKGSPFLKGRLDVHDISPEAVKPILQKARWDLSPTISGGLKLNAPAGNGKNISLMNISRKANKAGGGRYGNGFHSPRFGYNHNAFDLYPHVSSTPVEMTMGARKMVEERKANGEVKTDRQGNPKTKSEMGKIIPQSVKVGKTNWGKGYGPNQG